MKKTCIVLYVAIVACLLILLGCGAGAVHYAPPAVANSISLAASDWNHRYASGMPEHPAGAAGEAWAFQIPKSPAYLGYLTTAVNLTTSAPPKGIIVSVRIDGTAPVYNGQVTAGEVDPATFHLFIERKGDDITDRDKCAYRQWCSPGYTFGERDGQVVTLACPFTADMWSDVFGVQSQSGLDATIRDMGWVGMTFGGWNFFGHGMNLLGGDATFTLIDYRFY